MSHKNCSDDINHSGLSNVQSDDNTSASRCQAWLVFLDRMVNTLVKCEDTVGTAFVQPKMKSSTRSTFEQMRVLFSHQFLLITVPKISLLISNSNTFAETIWLHDVLIHQIKEGLLLILAFTGDVSGPHRLIKGRFSYWCQRILDAWITLKISHQLNGTSNVEIPDGLRASSETGDPFIMKWLKKRNLKCM